jgi:hypothetical protein
LEKIKKGRVSGVRVKNQKSNFMNKGWVAEKSRKLQYHDV